MASWAYHLNGGDAKTENKVAVKKRREKRAGHSHRDKREINKEG